MQYHQIKLSSEVFRMKIQEVKKGENYNRGRVLLAVSGTEQELDFFSKMIADSDFSDSSADYREEEEKEGMFNDSYVVDRAYVKEFRSFYMSVKAMVKAGEHLKEEVVEVAEVDTANSVATVGVEVVKTPSPITPALINKVAISALMSFCGITFEKAVKLLKESKGSLIDAARLHKLEQARAPVTPSESASNPSPTNPTPTATKPTVAPPIASSADIERRLRLRDEFTRLTGETNEIAFDYLEAEEWDLGGALISYRGDQEAFKKANNF